VQLTAGVDFFDPADESTLCWIAVAAEAEHKRFAHETG